MGHYFATTEQSLIKLSMISREHPFTLNDIFIEFPKADKNLIKSILDECINEGAINYDGITDSYVSNYELGGEFAQDGMVIEEVHPTNFIKWRDSLTIEDFESYLVENCDDWDCEFLCPAYEVCYSNPDKKYHFCQHPEEFIKWANSEVENNG